MCELPPVRNHGDYPLEALPSGWSNAWIKFKPTGEEERKRIEIIELDSSVRYPQEPLVMISCKCLGLFLVANPAYFLVYTTLQLTRLVVVPIVNCSPLAIFKEAWKIVKIPLLFIGMQFGALYGIFCPLQGRALFARCESALYNKTRRKAEQYRKEPRPSSEFLHEAIFKEEPDRAFFIAFCMQPIGHLSDEHITHEFVDQPAV